MEKKSICILTISIYFIVIYYNTKYFWEHNILFSINELTMDILFLRIIKDTIDIIVPLIIMTFIWNRRKDYGIQIKVGIENVIPLISLGLTFIIRHEYSLVGIYKLIFYLFYVATCEEVVFRGYIFNVFSKKKWCGIIISGSLWGMFHAIVPNIINMETKGELFISALNYIGGGIAGGLIFLFFNKKENQLFLQFYCMLL